MKERLEELKQSCTELGTKLGTDFMIFAFEVFKELINNDNQESYSKEEILDLINDMVKILQE